MYNLNKKEQRKMWTILLFLFCFFCIRWKNLTCMFAMIRINPPINSPAMEENSNLDVSGVLIASMARPLHTRILHKKQLYDIV